MEYLPLGIVNSLLISHISAFFFSPSFHLSFFSFFFVFLIWSINILWNKEIGHATSLAKIIKRCNCIPNMSTQWQGCSQQLGWWPAIKKKCWLYCRPCMKILISVLNFWWDFSLLDFYFFRRLYFRLSLVLPINPWRYSDNYKQKR